MSKLILNARKTLAAELTAAGANPELIQKLVDLSYPLPVAKPVEPKTVLVTLYTDDDSFDVEMTKLRTVHHDDGCEDGFTTYYKATKPGGFRKMDRDDIRAALRDGFGRRCSHEHDCCGCYFGGAGGITVRRGALFFNTHYSRNV